MIPVESRAFTVSSHASQAFHQMSEMRDQNILCDIVLCVGMKEFRAHRIVLAGCSPYLKAMFTNGMMESDKSYITLHDFDPSTLEILLDYMYRGQILITVDNVQAVMQGASMLGLIVLRNVCSQFLQQHIDASNCLGIQSFADMYSCVELEANARQYIYRHFLDVVQHEEFLNLPEDRLVPLLQSNTLQVAREEQVFEAVMLWINWEPGRRIRSSCSVFKHVRLALLDAAYLENIVLRIQFVQSCPKCQSLVANAIRTKSDKRALVLSLRSQPHGIFVLGGRNSTDCQLCSMEWYDVMKDRWVSMAPLKIARTAVGAASLGDIIYAVGGECAFADAQEDTVYLNSVEAYNPALKEWRHCAELKMPRSFVSVCAAGKYIYAIGGEDKVTTYNVVEKYDVSRDVWSFAPNMKKARSGAGVAVCNGKIYVAGGYDKNMHTDRASVECFDLELQEWSFVTEMEKARSGLLLVALDHYLYAIGGRSRYTDFYYSTIERYNTLTHQWTSVTQMNTQRAWPGVAILDNNIYVMGGFDGINRLQSVEVYNVDQDSWTFIAPMSVCRAGCSAAVL